MFFFVFTSKHTIITTLDIQLRCVYFVHSKITNLPQRALQSVQTHTTSLTFDLTSDQEQLPRKRKKPFSGKKRRTLEESNRGQSLSRMDRTIDVM